MIMFIIRMPRCFSMSLLNTTSNFSLCHIRTVHMAFQKDKVLFFILRLFLLLIYKRIVLRVGNKTRGRCPCTCSFYYFFIIKLTCYLLFLDKKKVTKEPSPKGELANTS